MNPTNTSQENDIPELVGTLQNTDLETPISHEFVDISAATTELIEVLADIPTHPPSFYINLQGVRLSWNGSISVIQLLVSPLK